MTSKETLTHEIYPDYRPLFNGNGSGSLVMNDGSEYDVVEEEVSFDVVENRKPEAFHPDLMTWDRENDGKATGCPGGCCHQPQLHPEEEDF
ncbi:hypothetical protein CR513_49433, partial [Mucuna pruriens]